MIFSLWKKLDLLDHQRSWQGQQRGQINFVQQNIELLDIICESHEVIIIKKSLLGNQVKVAAGQTTSLDGAFSLSL